MRTIGWVGLGKLGLPEALTLALRGRHRVVGYDVSDHPRRVLAGEVPPPRERDLAGLLARNRRADPDSDPRLLLAVDVADVVAETDGIIFVAVPTPHAPGYDGSEPVRGPARDFDYTYLLTAVGNIIAAIREDESDRWFTLAVVSTTLPGTLDRLVTPLLPDRVGLVYAPSLIALGTVVPDFEDPEFIILGGANSADLDRVAAVLLSVGPGTAVAHRMSVTSAEVTKIAHNTQLTQRITFANTVRELCHGLGADTGPVLRALGSARPRRLRAGLVDGGPCRPRDLVALSWLVGAGGGLSLSYDPFAELVAAREVQTRWLASRVVETANRYRLPIAVLGRSYKADSDLVAGSPATLLTGMLPVAPDRDVWDPLVDGPSPPEGFFDRPRVFVVATPHLQFAGQSYPPGSVLFDPWNHVRDRDGITVVRPGWST